MMKVIDIALTDNCKGCDHFDETRSIVTQNFDIQQDNRLNRKTDKLKRRYFGHVTW